MCETVEKIKFCTCLKDGNIDTVIHNKNSRRHKQKFVAVSGRIYKWVLSKYAGNAHTQMDGMLAEPAHTLNEDITDTDLVKELNERNCFDFEYQPCEGDNLEVWVEPGSYRGPMSFIFSNNQWNIRRYNGFVDKTEKVNYGSVRFE